MNKNITNEDINGFRQSLMTEIVNLLKEYGLPKLEFEFDEEEPDYESAIYIMHYHPRFDSWNEIRVTAIGIAEDGEMFLEAYDDTEGDKYSVYADDLTSHTSNLEWLIGLRSKIKSTLNISEMTMETDCEYADIAERLHQVEQDMFHFMKKILKEKGKISLGLSKEDELDKGNFPVTTTLYGRHDTPRIRLTDIYLDGEYIYADGIDDETDEKRTEFIIYSEQYADVFQFIGHCMQ